MSGLVDGGVREWAEDLGRLTRARPTTINMGDACNTVTDRLVHD